MLIKLDTLKLDDFWYIDAHNLPYKLSKPSAEFLEDNFIIESNIDLLDCWAKFYTKKTNQLKTIDISKFNLEKKMTSSKITYWIESFLIENNVININGWAYLNKKDAYSSRIRIVLIRKEGVSYELPVQMNRRIDITENKNDDFNYDNSGFSLKITTDKVKQGEYKIGILIKSNNQQELVITDKTFVK